jgi:hypothetical protein
MSSIGAGGITLQGLNPRQSIGSTPDNQSISLNGIDWNRLQPSNTTQTINYGYDDNVSVNRPNSGTVPANDQLPPMFDTTVTPTKSISRPKNQNNQGAEIQPEADTKKDDGVATGVGMAIGAIGGGLIGRSMGGVKMGIGLGVIVGGFIGNFFEKK